MRLWLVDQLLHMNPVIRNIPVKISTIKIPILYQVKITMKIAILYLNNIVINIAS